jgi:hypothetical protein
MLVGEDRSRPVSLVGKTVRFTMVDSNIEPLTVEDKYNFATVSERDEYFVAIPAELVDGLVVQVTTAATPTTPEIVVQYRYRNTEWHTDVTKVIDDKLCDIVDGGKGSISYSFTVEEARRAGMYHIYYRVITPVEGHPGETYDAKYPKGDSLWIHIMDIFTEY